MKVPFILPRPWQRDPRIPSDYIVVDSKDGLSVHANPGDLIYMIIFQNQFYAELDKSHLFTYV